MPRNAIATGLVDFVLPAGSMPERIVSYLNGLPLPSIPDPIDAVPLPFQDEPSALREIISVLRVRTGHDFANYKEATLRRRVERRVNLTGLTSISGYAHYIRQHPEEALALMKELLISVTNFFRDPAAWVVLQQRAIPRLFEGKGYQDQVRAWVSGCATGEEAYSLAMLLADHGATLNDQPSIQVFATDLDEQAIATAREGPCTAKRTSRTSPRSGYSASSIARRPASACGASCASWCCSRITT